MSETDFRAGFEIGDVVQIGKYNRFDFSYNNERLEGEVIEFVPWTDAQIKAGCRPVRVLTVNGTDWGQLFELKLITPVDGFTPKDEGRRLLRYLTDNPLSVSEITKKYFENCSFNLQEGHRRIRKMLRNLEIDNDVEFIEKDVGWKRKPPSYS